jgi:SurA N-terminal domain
VTRKHTGRLRVRRRSVQAAVALAAVGLAVSACGTTQLGAAAITGGSRISSATLTDQVANLGAAYQADQAKGVKPQRPTGQEAQQVLTWLILFRIYDKVAEQQGINVTPAQANNQLATLTTQASQSKVTLEQYLSAGGAVPPDLEPQLGQYFAILTTLESRLNGGTAPTTTAEQTKVAGQVEHAQCLAAKSLGVQVNPQFGVFDYRTYSVVLGTPKLAANPTPSPSASQPELKPPC